MRKLKIEELNRIDVETFQQKQKIPVVVVCDNIRSMYNVGSVFRTADGFLVEKIWLCGITASPPHKEIRKTALGATDSVEWEYAKEVIDVVKELQQKGYAVIAVEQAEGSISLDEFEVDRSKKYVLIFGNEVDGVDQQLLDICDHALEIPQSGTKHSLNISVCAGIVLWKFYKNLI